MKKMEFTNNDKHIEYINFLEKLPVEPSVYYRYLKDYKFILVLFKLVNINYAFAQDLFKLYNNIAKEKMDYNKFLNIVKKMEKDKLIIIFKVNKYNAICLNRLGFRLLYTKGLYWTDTVENLKKKKEKGIKDFTRQDPKKVTNNMLVKSSLKINAYNINRCRYILKNMLKELPIFMDGNKDIHLILTTSNISNAEKYRKHIKKINILVVKHNIRTFYIHSFAELDKSSKNFLKNYLTCGINIIYKTDVEVLKPFNYLPIK